MDDTNNVELQPKEAEEKPPEIKVAETQKATGIEIKIPIEELRKRKLFLATPMYGGNCLFSDTVVQTEMGPKTIKWVVDNRYDGKVLSFDHKKNEFEWNKVLGHSGRRNGRRGTPEKKFVKVITDRSASKSITVTEDHRCAILDNPLFPNDIYYDEAKNLFDKYVVNNAGNPLFNSEQMSVIIGMMLGDGHITPHGTFKVIHAAKQKDYLEYIQSIIGGTVIEEKKSGFSKTPKYSLSLPVNAQTKHLRSLMYAPKKSIDDVIPYINDVALAFWYMDDGYLIKEYDRGSYTEKAQAMLCTDGFTYDECVKLCEMFQKKWEIKASPIKYRKYYRIAISKSGSIDFWRIISPYIPDSMKYKLPDNFNHAVRHTFNNHHLGFSSSKVRSVNHYKRYSKLYDIEVDKVHNFIANNTVVHNCGGMYTRSVADLVAVCANYGIQVQMYFLFNESLITRARNYCCDEFVRSQCTHLLFLDSDIGFNPQDVIAMLALQSDDSPYDIIGAPYPKKCIAWEKIKKAVDKGFADENPNELDKFVGDYVFNPKSGSGSIPIHVPSEVMEIGTGFMMMRRKTLEVFRDKYPYMLYRPDHVRTEHFDGSREIMAFFDCVIDRGYDIGDLIGLLKDGIDGKTSGDDVLKQAEKWFEAEKKASKRYFSEDYKFCYDAARAGLKVWLCPWMKTQHVGTFVFGGSLLDLAQLGAAATADIEELNRIKDSDRRKRGELAKVKK